jgi:hypothetical protein
VNTPPSIVTTSPLPGALTGSVYTQTLAATGTAPITWSVTSGTLPAGLSLGSSTGIVSGTPTAPGIFTFTASATNAGGSNSEQLSLTVNTPVTVSLTPSSVSLLPSQNQTFTATVGGTSNTGVTWSFTPASASLVSGGTTALYLAPSTAPTTTSGTIIATSIADPSKAATAVITRLQAITVFLSPSTVTLSPSGTQQFTAAVLGTSNTAVTWSINPSVGTISSAGLYTAPSSILTSQTVTVMAQSVGDPTKSSSATISLSPPTVTFTYYVDSVNGSDSNPGTLARPWQTIAKVNGLPCGSSAGQLGPGMSVGFHSGATWREQLIVPCSGAAGNPITFGAYGIGAQPIISGSNIVSSASWMAVRAMYCSPTSADPLQMIEDGALLPEVLTQSAVVDGTYWFDSANSKVCLQTFDGSDPSGHVIEAAVRTNAIYLIGSYLNGYGGSQYITISGITLEGAQGDGLNAGANYSGLVVNNITARLNHAFGAQLFDYLSTTLSNSVVENSTFSHNGASGLWILNYVQGNGLVVSNNVADYNALIQTDTGNYQWVAGIYVNCNGSNSSPVTITGNNSTNNGSMGNGVDVGVGIWSDTCNNVTVSYNSTANNWGPGVMLENNNNSEAIYNVSNADDVYGTSLSSTSGGGIHLQTESASNACVIANNTIYGTYIGIGLLSYNGSTLITNLKVENNIAYGSTGYALFGGTGANGAGNTYTYNSFGLDSSSTLAYYKGAPYSTYASLQTALGYTAHSVAGNPLFTNPMVGDFTLQAGSPAIGAGVYIPGVSTANPPNIGAK